MTTVTTTDDLLILARTIRTRARERSDELAELLDDCEVRGDSAMYHAAAAEAYPDLEDDLWNLLEQVERAARGPEWEARHARAAAAIAADDAAASNDEGDRGRLADGPDDADSDDDLEQGPDGGDHDNDVDHSDLDGDLDDLTDAPRPVPAMDSVPDQLPILAADTSLRVPLPTLSVRMRRDSEEYRKIFDPKRGQLTVAASGGGDRLGAFHLALLDLLDDELTGDEPVFMCLAIDVGDASDETKASDEVTVVSGWAVGHVDWGSNSLIEFDDGAAVHLYEITAMKLG